MLTAVNIQRRMRFYESASAEKGRRLNASFFSTYRGHTPVMCCEWLAARHAERAHFYSFSEVEEGGMRVCVSVCLSLAHYVAVCFSVYTTAKMSFQ